MSNKESKPSKDLEIAPAKKLCDVFNNPYYTRIRAMTWQEFSEDLVAAPEGRMVGSPPGRGTTVGLNWSKNKEGN